MPAADVADLRAMSDDELASELDETRRALFNLRFQAATRQLADVSQVRRARRRVARIKTLQHERAVFAAYGEIAAAEADEDAASVVEDAEPETTEDVEPAASEDAEAVAEDAEAASEAAEAASDDEGQEE